jgi:putative membrane protein
MIASPNFARLVYDGDGSTFGPDVSGPAGSGTIESVFVRSPPPDLDHARRTSMAAERTWLAWWRTALAASAGALAVGRLAPELLEVSSWPYVLLGCAYAALAIGLLIVGAQRQRALERALETGAHEPLRFRTVVLFTSGAIALALMTVVLVVAQT